jgi:hypothetical protein
MENLKNVAPIEDFNWDAYENGETVTNVSHAEGHSGTNHDRTDFRKRRSDSCGTNSAQ